jgi:hypothetical protein
MSETDKSDKPQIGPKMQVLNERQRKFVESLFNDDLPPKGKGRHILAAKLAGYGNPAKTSTDHSIGVIAAHLIGDPRIQSAIAE